MSEELARFVTRLLPAKLILTLARTHGIQKRQRIFHIVPPVWVLVLVSLATPNQSFAQWHRFLLTVTSWRLNSRSCFYDRLSPSLCTLFKALLTRALATNRRAHSHWLAPALAGDFEQVLALDSSVINLRDSLMDS